MSEGLGGYGRLLADPAARWFSTAGLLGRMQISMTGLSTVLLISIVTGSFTRAGLVTAAATLTGAAITPFWGRSIDRIGQARVLVLTALLFTLGAGVLIVTVLERWPLWTTLAAAVLSGTGISQAGNAVRARWAHRLSDPAQRDVAFALEAVVDELIFITGPLLVTFACTTVHPALGLVIAAALTLGGSVWLASQRRTEPPVHQVGADELRERLPGRRLAPVVVCCLALGVVFGGMEVAIVAYAGERGILSGTGLFTMAWALGSLVAGAVTGGIAWKAPPGRRFRIGTLALAVSLAPLPFLSWPGVSPWVMGVVLVLSGFAIAPTLIASVAVVQGGVPASRLTEALGWTQTGLAAGIAVGGAVVGRTVDVWHAFGAFVALALAGVVLVAGSLSVPAAGRPSADEPAVAPEPEPS
ncbi:MFS family permease [Friedmanniella endophytica]|uniref:MFS family permease n=2 Tax=Microlunatus kandeliicorticis TaxID=1759536 RepID=A0A7W3P7S9_9ACTN|nr:MFS transporter [Microlunatus kandeliicorticis]MBA8796320.1 MFS family permease [Microlunatus kandeliicorticis]